MSRLADEPGLAGHAASAADVGRPQSSNGSVSLGIERLGRTTNKSLRASWNRHCEAEPGEVESGGDAKASPGRSDEYPRVLKTQEGIGLLAELIPLLVVTDCCPAQGPEGGATRAGVVGFGWR